MSSSRRKIQRKKKRRVCVASCTIFTGTHSLRQTVFVFFGCLENLEITQAGTSLLLLHRVFFLRRKLKITDDKSNNTERWARTSDSSGYWAPTDEQPRSRRGPRGGPRLQVLARTELGSQNSPMPRLIIYLDFDIPTYQVIRRRKNVY